MSVDTQDSLWVASASGLHSVNAQTGEVRSQFICQPLTIRTKNLVPIPGHPRYEPSKNFLRQFSSVMDERQKFVTARRRESAANCPFQASSRLMGSPRAVLPDGEFVWVASAAAGNSYGPSLLLYHPFLYWRLRITKLAITALAENLTVNSSFRVLVIRSMRSIMAAIFVR
jgi:hypothetical protein